MDLYELEATLVPDSHGYIERCKKHKQSWRNGLAVRLGSHTHTHRKKKQTINARKVKHD